jgi:hypothetical protein
MVPLDDMVDIIQHTLSWSAIITSITIYSSITTTNEVITLDRNRVAVQALSVSVSFFFRPVEYTGLRFNARRKQN